MKSVAAIAAAAAIACCGLGAVLADRSFQSEAMRPVGVSTQATVHGGTQVAAKDVVAAKGADAAPVTTVAAGGSAAVPIEGHVDPDMPEAWPASDTLSHVGDYEDPVAGVGADPDTAVAHLGEWVDPDGS